MPIPSEPIVFMKATTCISGPSDDVVQPKNSTKLDWEIELGVVIGTQARTWARPRRSIDTSPATAS
jgi:2-keto-4-pentenoate hydratase/2-oxohepta-3-ene-1,7-dioic acid hydratase in catechol pathway